MFVRHADFCRVFSDVKRLRIMWFLGTEEKSVREIAVRIGASMQNTSQHLRVLRDKGAVRVRRDGQTAWYRASHPKLLAGCELIRAGLIEIDRDRARSINRETSHPRGD